MCMSPTDGSFSVKELLLSPLNLHNRVADKIGMREIDPLYKANKKVLDKQYAKPKQRVAAPATTKAQDYGRTPTAGLQIRT